MFLSIKWLIRISYHELLKLNIPIMRLLFVSFGFIIHSVKYFPFAHVSTTSEIVSFCGVFTSSMYLNAVSLLIHSNKVCSSGYGILREFFFHSSLQIQIFKLSNQLWYTVTPVELGLA